MISTDLQDIVTSVVRRAQGQGSVAARDVRDELTRAGLPTDLWKDVVARARPALRYSRGRYRYVAPVSERVQQQQQQQEQVRRAVRELVRRHREDGLPAERRRQERIDFIHPVRVQTEDGRVYQVLSRDLSPSGIRLVGTRGLLGQKIRVFVPLGDDGGAQGFLVRVLWTCAVGDDLVENGGAFLEVLTGADKLFGRDELAGLSRRR